ncbi:hypothetical protein B0H13DRAFT_2384679 [Mycena leptocephala]|nr:hypothetical protein B0H13DRAFT_2384679 [Mycena leptocephala]
MSMDHSCILNFWFLVLAKAAAVNKAKTKKTLTFSRSVTSVTSTFTSSYQLKVFNCIHRHMRNANASEFFNTTVPTSLRSASLL